MIYSLFNTALGERNARLRVEMTRAAEGGVKSIPIVKQPEGLYGEFHHQKALIICLIALLSDISLSRRERGARSRSNII